MASVAIQNDQEDRKAFGAFLAQKRLTAGPKKVKQSEILKHLSGWSPASYSRLEDGITAPNVADLPAIHAAFRTANISFSFAEAQQFITLARRRIQLQQTYKYERSEDEWAQLLLGILQFEGQIESSVSVQNRRLSFPFLPDIGHLIDRPLWREELDGLLAPMRRKKLVIVRGAAGIGKSSELSRLAVHSIRDSFARIILHNLHFHEHICTPEEALEETLSILAMELSVPLPQQPPGSFEMKTTLLLDALERLEQRFLILLDHGECLFQEPHRLAVCWERFFSAFLAARHSAQMVLATRTWFGWVGNDPLFVGETTIPPLSQEQAVQLLRQLGLHALASDQLQAVYQVVGGIPLCLQWLVTLVQQVDQVQWESFEIDGGHTLTPEEKVARTSAALQRLLTESHMLGGPMEYVVTPFLKRLLATQSLSQEARQLLHVLSLAGIPLAKPALAALCCSGPAPYEELYRASLVVALRARVQLLPLVAGAIAQGLSSEQRQQAESLLITGYKAWLNSGQVASHREAGNLVTELALLLLQTHRLLDAAQVLLRYGWLSFQLGHATRLARFTQETIQESRTFTPEQEYGSLLLHYFLASFLGLHVDEDQKIADHQRIHAAMLSGTLLLHPSIEVAVTYTLMTAEMDALRFEQAQALYDECWARLQVQAGTHPDLQGSFMEKQAWLWARWSEYAEELGNKEHAAVLEKQAVALYGEMISLLTPAERCTCLERSFLQKRLARALNNLAYQLNRRGQYAEALEAIEQSIELKEQGYVEIDTLADAYGEKSQILARLGHFQEALVFDEKAYAETLRLANAGFSFSQEELRVYQVNRGWLYLRLGRLEEAEQLLHGALPLPSRRRIYAMVAEHTLKEIKHWREMSATNTYQLDWRWTGRYRTLASFDSYWWLAPAGPFTPEEQQIWDEAFAPDLDEGIKEKLGDMLYEARQRELEAALTEQREPRFSYPALAIGQVQEHIAGLMSLQTEIERQEPHPIVHRLYHEVIEEELDFLLLIKATHEGNTQDYWERGLRLHPIPTPEEMQYTLGRVRFYVQQGLLQSDPEIVAASRQVAQMLEALGVLLDFSANPAELEEVRQTVPLSASTQPRKMISAQAVKRFFSTILQENGYAEWQVVIDPNATSARIEQGQRCIYLPNEPLSLGQIKADLSHELAGHVARCIAGERSKLGLLGIHTKGSLETEEGLATYYDRQTAAFQGTPYDETGIWFGTLATGLASGVLVPPQTFRHLVMFFEEFIYLYRLLRRPDQLATTARKWAHKIALERGIRTYRGVPDLTKPGICYSKDALYLRGLRKIEQVVAQDGEEVLDRLAVGVVALEQLPDLAELGITQTPQPLRKLVQDPNLASYILSFDV